jgi:hypothetical protein
MVKTFETPDISNITIDKLALNPGDLNGNLISGGTITNFSSTGITDNSTKSSLIVEDDRITVKSIRVDSIENNLTVRGDVKVFGVLDAGLIRTTEIIANQRYEKQFIEFANPTGGPVNTGLLWSGAGHNKQLIFKDGPDRFWITENLDMPGESSYMIDGEAVISKNGLGTNVKDSNLSSVGTLKKLTVAGTVNIADHIFFNPSSERLSIGTEDPSGKVTIYDYANDVELILDSNDKGYGVIGTYNTKGLEIVTDQQARITVELNGDVTVGHENKDGTHTRVYGKLSVGIKNPREQFEVAGNIRWGNRLFANGDRPPLSGSYSFGDIIWNSNPKAQTYIGWVCIQGGTPGQWKPFGLISN